MRPGAPGLALPERDPTERVDRRVDGLRARPVVLDPAAIGLSRLWRRGCGGLLIGRRFALVLAREGLLVLLADLVEQPIQAEE
jgi:hypothetical protein